MYAVWVISEDASLPATLAYHLRALGTVWTGPPDAGHFKDADAPDLVIVAAAHPGDERAGLERLLGFLRGIPHPQRAAAPVLYAEAASGRPPAPLVRALVDDRPLVTLPWPLDPARLTAEAVQLLYRPDTPPSLRERARREWVAAAVERLYAGLELPALRRAIDPHNARRPVLLVGEPGTRRGLLARYIHNLAEPPRDEFIALPVWGLRPGEVESHVLGRAAGRRATVYLQHLERAEAVVQEELAQLLAESGALGIEPVRWIASALRPEGLIPPLRAWTWLQVDLPALRERPDRVELAQSLAAAWCESSGRWIGLGADAQEALAGYTWPGNLRELESVLDASLGACADAELEAAGLCFSPGAPPDASSEPQRAPAQPGPAPAPGTPAPPARAYESPETSLEPRAIPPAAPVAASNGPPDAKGARASETQVRDLMGPLAEEIRGPLRAIRTYANLLEQRPDDANLRQELSGLLGGDLSRVERTLQRLERFATFGSPRPQPVDLAALVSSELDARQGEMRERQLVVLRELDNRAEPAIVDEEQLRFAIGALLDRALRMVPDGGDLYLGSFYRDAQGERPAGHRLLIRFHSPEDVLVSPDDLPGEGTPIEVVLSRELIDRMGGASALDASGSQDNLILIELPA